MKPADIPLAVYLHFPWCVSKCPYCDFNSFANKEPQLPEQRYLDSLLADLAAQRERFAVERPVVSVFMGGGTPSLFSPVSMARVMDFLRANFRLVEDAEVTMEANPGTLERGRFRAYREAGINRVSLGVQSFDDAKLERLGRIHSASDARRAAEELHAAGLGNFNLDLMYGLPEQSTAAAVADVAAALALEPAHISHYQLTMEPGTPFAADPPALPDDDNIAVMLQECQALLASDGFSRYEVSAYARDGRRCRHNLNYWLFGDYLGAGAGAHGKLTTDAGILRTLQTREPRRYMSTAVGALTIAAVVTAQIPFEFMLNGLRLLGGFTTAEFRSRTGLDWAAVAAAWERGVQAGLLTSLPGDRHRATARGFDFLNEALVEFLPGTRG
jgi:putative oxygen-independent coproporphyrinogen III oxidase